MNHSRGLASMGSEALMVSEMDGAWDAAPKLWLLRCAKRAGIE